MPMQGRRRAPRGLPESVLRAQESLNQEPLGFLLRLEPPNPSRRLVGFIISDLDESLSNKRHLCTEHHACPTHRVPPAPITVTVTLGVTPACLYMAALMLHLWEVEERFVPFGGLARVVRSRQPVPGSPSWVHSDSIFARCSAGPW
ncbi:unnamed protein product [Rangifer tarandus platyrhynchus]|uniref:Uncharacterized protein n=1 Tax=Rangifer tarandus platyrhynchus TaxID=3082113 RepID=A0ABN8YL76_RANTA|nr:unnamed protein product [Rangifer tarandus platyrhynchus]